jgi:hypothetical protein
MFPDAAQSNSEAISSTNEGLQFIVNQLQINFWSLANYFAAKD